MARVYEREGTDHAIERCSRSWKSDGVLVRITDGLSSVVGLQVGVLLLRVIDFLAHVNRTFSRRQACHDSSAYYHIKSINSGSLTSICRRSGQGTVYPSLYLCFEIKLCLYMYTIKSPWKEFIEDVYQCFHQFCAVLSFLRYYCIGQDFNLFWLHLKFFYSKFQDIKKFHHSDYIILRYWKVSNISIFENFVFENCDSLIFNTQSF